MKSTKKNRINIKKVLISFFIILLVVLIGIFSWLSSSYDFKDKAKEASISDENVVVEQNDYIVFTPKDTKVTKGFIFYPGAKVEPMSYAPLCRQIAEEGYLVVIVPMPLNFAIFNPDEGEAVINLYKDIDTWAIGGHSLGGVMASSLAAKEDKIKAVALYASYPQGDELEFTDKKVISIYGSNDGVAKIENVKNAKLPEGSIIHEIDGGNHAGFGDYGDQSGDNEATITNEEQMKIAADFTVKLLKEVQ